MGPAAAPLSEKHLGEIERAVARALAQWLQGAEGAAPEQVVAGLERVLLFLRQNGSPSRQAAQVTSLALAWGAQVARAAPWRWMNVAEAGEALNPALVSADGAHACRPIDVVTLLVMEQGAAPLGQLYRRLVAGELPAPTPGQLTLVGEPTPAR